MEQILVNLVVNARDAMPDGGTLRIETRSAHLDPWFSREHAGVESGSYVELAVSDHGVGMTEEVRAHVFEPFYTTKETGKGTGLGLAMVYGAVHQNRGCVDVVSEPSRGTTFTIYLPAAEDAGPRISAADHERIPRGTETIVLVEDDSNVRQVAVRMLQRQGYTVCPCADGKEALAALGGASASTAPAHVKLLVTDVVMPGMNGRSLADKARGMLPDLKILFTSGYPEDTVAHHGVVEEGIEFLAKPYTLTGLATRVREVLDGPAAIRETR
jgi:CheY-like chemotaxis protein